MKHVISRDIVHNWAYNFNQHSKNCRFNSKQSLRELVTKLHIELRRRQAIFHVAPGKILQVCRRSDSCPLITIPCNPNSNNPNTVN